MEPTPEEMSNLATHPEDSDEHAILFLHCTRDMVVEDLARMALEDGEGQRSHVWETRRHTMRP
jgi:hypothetical protein